MARLSHKALVERARKAKDTAVDAVYAAAHPRMDVRFSDCFAMASAEVKQAYEAARDALQIAEENAIAAGKAYRASFGMLTFYR